MQSKTQKLRLLLTHKVLIGTAAIALVGGLGTLLATAQTPVASSEAENGALSGNVSSVQDASASNGSTVQFGAVATVPVNPTAYDAAFVTASGTKFKIGGQDFRFVGANVYNAAGSTASGKYSCGGSYSDSDLNAAFSDLHTKAGAGVIRFWAYQSYTHGGTDWSQLDRVITIAAQNHLKVIPVIENQLGDCTQYGFKDGSWYATNYQKPYGSYTLSYPDYVKVITQHYKNSPTIMSWQLMNEAESSDFTSLFNFTSSMSQLVKTTDPNHLVTLGTLADNGQAGTETVYNGPNHYEQLYAIPTIDYAEAHDYGQDQQALPRSSYDVGSPLPDAATCVNSIACDMSVSVTELHKPFLIGEVGIQATISDNNSLQSRSALLQAKVNAQWQNGGSGFIVWQWSSDSGNDNYRFLTSDPLLPMLKTFASPFNL